MKLNTTMQYNTSKIGSIVGIADLNFAVIAEDDELLDAGSAAVTPALLGLSGSWWDYYLLNLDLYGNDISYRINVNFRLLIFLW